MHRVGGNALRGRSMTVEDVVQQLVERDDLVLMTAEALDAARRTRLRGRLAPSADRWERSSSMMH
jgi:hypothetical protein